MHEFIILNCLFGLMGYKLDCQIDCLTLLYVHIQGRRLTKFLYDFPFHRLHGLPKIAIITQCIHPLFFPHFMSKALLFLLVLRVEKPP